MSSGSHPTREFSASPTVANVDLSEKEDAKPPHIIVDWEGPDDPLNPKKSVCQPESQLHPAQWKGNLAQLESKEEMGSYSNCFGVHVDLSGVVEHDCPS